MYKKQELKIRNILKFSIAKTANRKIEIRNAILIFSMNIMFQQDFSKTRTSLGNLNYHWKWTDGYFGRLV